MNRSNAAPTAVLALLLAGCASPQAVERAPDNAAASSASARRDKLTESAEVAQADPQPVRTR